MYTVYTIDIEIKENDMVNIFVPEISGIFVTVCVIGILLLLNSIRNYLS